MMQLPLDLNHRIKDSDVDFMAPVCPFSQKQGFPLAHSLRAVSVCSVGQYPRPPAVYVTGRPPPSADEGVSDCRHAALMRVTRASEPVKGRTVEGHVIPG